MQVFIILTELPQALALKVIQVISLGNVGTIINLG